MSCFGREDKNEKDQRIKSKAIDDQLKKDKALYKDTHTLVLLGKLWTKNRCYSFITSVSYCKQAHVSTKYIVTQNKLHVLLLEAIIKFCIGDEYSGKDIIVKQMKFLFKNGYTDK